jgi:hypothetical protein
MGYSPEYYQEMDDADKVGLALNPKSGMYEPMWQIADSQWTPYQQKTGADGLLQDKYQMKYQPIDNGSGWERNMRDKLSAESAQASDQANAGRNSAWATARSGLAMRGGMSGGANERMASDAARESAFANQDMARQQMVAGLGIGAQAEDRKLDLSKYNNDQRTKLDLWNREQALGEGRFSHESELERYKAKMQGIAGQAEAQGVARS